MQKTGTVVASGYPDNPRILRKRYRRMLGAIPASRGANPDEFLGNAAARRLESRKPKPPKKALVKHPD
jgi:hypothetical protein